MCTLQAFTKVHYLSADPRWLVIYHKRVSEESCGRRLCRKGSVKANIGSH